MGEVSVSVSMVPVLVSGVSMELVERVLSELEACEAIYDQECCIDSETARLACVEAVERGDESFTGRELGISISIKGDENEHFPTDLKLHCRLPIGYPDRPLSVYVSCPSLQRKHLEELSNSLGKRAQALAGNEAVMELVQELQEILSQNFKQWENDMARDNADTATDRPRRNHQEPLLRCWIWAHHIKNSERQKSILREARERGLGGYLKSGYPGIVVVEGDRCLDFITWIKGNKSRPGGFGRNWGHHVRCQREIEERAFPFEFTEIHDMGELGSKAKSVGLENEFLEYVLQHK